MSKLKQYKFRELVKKLRKYDKRFVVFTEKGKGSHRMLYHPDILGRPVSFPLICHAEGDEVKVYYIVDIIRAFKLPDGTL